MNDRLDEEALKTLLRRAVPPSPELDLRRDLWPEMAGRLDQPPAGVPWVDWVLAAAAIIWLLLFPEALFPLLYHL